MSIDMGTRLPVLVVYGTRPEAIKMAPIVDALRASATLRPVVAVTGQHPEMVAEINDLFSITPDVDLNIFSPRQSLASITSRVLDGVGQAIHEHAPALAVVQGDTTSAFAAALSSFYQRVPVAHVEAGLRTGDLAHPFPEEANRSLIGRIAALHLAPTSLARANLLAEKVAEHDIVITGNTVIDALLRTVSMRPEVAVPELKRVFDDRRKVVLVTAHRRESWGAPMASIGRALAEIAKRPDVMLVLPAHPNPVVRADLLRELDAGADNVVITEPLRYSDFAQVLARADLILSDSGGVQEEAPSVGTPVLVMRTTTERMEAVHAGTAKLVGTNATRIVDSVRSMLDDVSEYRRAAEAANPFGDGHATQRVLAALEEFLGVGSRLEDFTPAGTVEATPS